MQVVHGLSIPLGKFGFFLPRTISRALASSSAANEEPQPFRIGGRIQNPVSLLRDRRNRRGASSTSSSARASLDQPRPIVVRGRANPDQPLSDSGSVRHVYHVGGSVIPPRDLPEMPPASVPNRTIRFPDEDPHDVPPAMDGEDVR